MLHDERERVSRLVSAFATDVRRTAGLDVDLAVEPSDDALGVTLTSRPSGDPLGQWTGHAAADALDWLVWLFDAIQHDWVVEQVHGAWPPCPRHPHPLVVRRTSSGVAWHCPADADVTAPVGAVASLVAP